MEDIEEKSDEHESDDSEDEKSEEFYQKELEWKRMELKKIQKKIKELENLSKSSDANESKQVNLIRKEFKEKIETLEKKRIAF